MPGNRYNNKMDIYHLSMDGYVCPLRESLHIGVSEHESVVKLVNCFHCLNLIRNGLIPSLVINKKWKELLEV